MESIASTNSKRHAPERHDAMWEMIPGTPASKNSDGCGPRSWVRLISRKNSSLRERYSGNQKSLEVHRLELEERASGKSLGGRPNLYGDIVPIRALRQQIALSYRSTNGRGLDLRRKRNGKELVARRALHAAAFAANRRFVEVIAPPSPRS